MKLLRVLHVLQESQHRAEFGHGIRRQTFRAVLQVETSQSLMDEAPDPHPYTVARYLTPVNSPGPPPAPPNDPFTSYRYRWGSPAACLRTNNDQNS